MDLKKLEHILRIAEEKNISRAAERLFISQPALNLQLLNLERELGTKLFARKGNECSVTEAGRIYVETARKMMNMKKDCYAKIAELSQLHNEEIAIGASGLQGDYMMCYIFQKFHEYHPNVKLQFTSMKGLKAQELVKNGTIDLGIVLMGDKQSYRMEYKLLGKVELLLAIAKNHPLLAVLEEEGEIAEIDLAKLSELPFVLAPKDSTERSVAEMAFEDAGIDPYVPMDVEGIHYQMALVESSDYCSFISSNNRTHVPDSIRLIPCKTHPKMNAVAVYRKDKPLTKALVELIALAEEYWSSFSEEESF